MVEKTWQQGLGEVLRIIRVQIAAPTNNPKARQQDSLRDQKAKPKKTVLRCTQAKCPNNKSRSLPPDLFRRTSETTPVHVNPKRLNYHIFRVPTKPTPKKSAHRSRMIHAALHLCFLNIPTSLFLLRTQIRNSCCWYSSTSNLPSNPTPKSGYR